jgi:hypothetical protein
MKAVTLNFYVTGANLCHVMAHSRKIDNSQLRGFQPDLLNEDEINQYVLTNITFPAGDTINVFVRQKD